MAAALEIARRNRLPFVNLVESGGADLPRQAEIFLPGGALFRDERSFVGMIPFNEKILGQSRESAKPGPHLRCSRLVN